MVGCGGDGDLHHAVAVGRGGVVELVVAGQVEHCVRHHERVAAAEVLVVDGRRYLSDSHGLTGRRRFVADVFGLHAKLVGANGWPSVGQCSVCADDAVVHRPFINCGGGYIGRRVGECGARAGLGDARDGAGCGKRGHLGAAVNYINDVGADVAVVAIHHEIVVLANCQRYSSRKVLVGVRGDIAVAVGDELEIDAIGALVNADLQPSIVADAAAGAVRDADPERKVGAGRPEGYPLSIVDSGCAEAWWRLAGDIGIVDTGEAVNITDHACI